MSIGIAIFASVVLLLIVYHKTFRKVFFWAAGIAVIGCGLFFGILYLYTLHQERVAAKLQAEQQVEQHAAAVKACIARFPSNDDQQDVAKWCEISPEVQPAPPPDSTQDSEKITCDILKENAPNDYIFDGSGHCSPKPHKTSAPKIMATVSDSDYCRILWSNNVGERHALLKFKGGEQVEYVGDEFGDPIIRYHGVRGYVGLPSCVKVGR